MDPFCNLLGGCTCCRRLSLRALLRCLNTATDLRRRNRGRSSTLSTIHTLSPSSLSCLLPLLICLFCRSLGSLLFLCFPRLITAKLLSPLLLFLGLDEREEILGFADCVADCDGLRFPLVGDDKERGIELFEDEISGIRPKSC